MEQVYPIYTTKTVCQDCYKCIRNCPAEAIRVEKGHATIIPERCIICGKCVKNCPVKAKHVRNDLPKTRTLLQQGKKVIASIDPSFVNEFEDFTPSKFIKALKHLGFYGVSETSIGAEILSSEIFKYISEHKEQKLFISSECPSVMAFIKMYFPHLEKFIIDLPSPLMAHARYLKKLYGEDAEVVSFSSCISRKLESDLSDGLIYSSVSMKSLRHWFMAESITADIFDDEEEEKFIPEESASGSIFVLEDGLSLICKAMNPSWNIETYSVSDISQIDTALSLLDVEKIEKPLFIELYSCAGGCINAPGCFKEKSFIERKIKLQSYVENKRCTGWKNVPTLGGKLQIPPKKPEEKITERTIKNILRSIGKTSPADEKNCSSCGYESCREFAKAIFYRRAEKSMCTVFNHYLSKQLLQAIPNGVFTVDKNLCIIECNRNFALSLGEDVLSQYENNANLEGYDIRKFISFSRIIESLFANNRETVIHREISERNRIFDVTVFVIEKDQIAGCVMEDVTKHRKQQNLVIDEARKVINKNLSVVQEIAFLLGENAAETESVLESMISSYSDEGVKDGK